MDGADWQKIERMTEQPYVQCPQANCIEAQPTSSQVEANFVSHFPGQTTSMQKFDEYAHTNRAIGFHSQEATFRSMQESFPRMESPTQKQAVPQNLK